MKLHWLWLALAASLIPLGTPAQDLAQRTPPQQQAPQPATTLRTQAMPDSNQVWVEFCTAAGPLSGNNAAVFGSSHLTVKVAADSAFLAAQPVSPRFTMRNIRIYTAENSSQEPRLLRTIASTGTVPVDIHVPELGVRAGNLVSIEVEEVFFVDQYANTVPLVLPPTKRAVRFRVF
jgi:hypothetical protein